MITQTSLKLGMRDIRSSPPFFSRPYIHECEQREKISKELTDLWDYPKYGCPHREGKRYFFSKNSGLQNQR